MKPYWLVLMAAVLYFLPGCSGAPEGPEGDDTVEATGDLSAEETATEESIPTE